MTHAGDIVLIYVEGNPAFFARIEDISHDDKPEWFQVKMLVLQVPLMVITWILRKPYIDGDEFTMGGRPMRLEKVVAPKEQDDDENEEVSPFEELSKAPPKPRGEMGKVVSLMDRKKKDQPS